MKLRLLLLTILFSVLSWGQASLPLARTTWNSTPLGWTDTPLDSYISTFACSTGNGAKFDTTGDLKIVNFNSPPNQLSFDVKSNTATTSVLLVEESVDGITYVNVVSLSGSAALPTTCTTKGPYTLNSTSRFVRWTFTHGTSYMTMDDVQISAAPTVFLPGDFAVIALNSNINCYPPGPNGAYGNGDDEISFITFKDIKNGDSFHLTDNGYERVTTGLWADTEGLYKFTRTGATIPAGTVITFRLLGSIPFVEFTSPSGGWSFVKEAGFAGEVVMNSNGDQIFFTQGGVWNNPGGTHDATYAPGTFLYAFNTNSSWASFGDSTQESGLPIDLRCFNLMPGSASDYLEYTGLTTAVSKLDWITRLNNPTNWTDRVNCTGFTRMHVGQVYSVITGGTYVDGVWVGSKSTDWFDCANWQTLKVPNATVNVNINSTYAIRDAIIDVASPNASIYGSIAKSNDITISSNKVQIEGNVNNKLEAYGNLLINGTGSLDMDDSNPATADGSLHLYKNWTNNIGNTSFLEGNGTVIFEGTTPQIINNVTPLGTEVFYNVVLNNSFDTTVSNDLVAEGNLVINLGKTLNIDSNGYVRVNNKLTHSGNLLIQNNGQFIQVNETDTNDGTYTGTKFQVNRTAQVRNLDYVYWSSPVENFAVSSLPNSSRYFWNTLTVNTNSTQGNWTNASGTMNKGQGYIARASNGATTNQAMNLSFSGKPNNGAFTLPIQRGVFDGSDYDAEPSNANNTFTTKYDDNWNLVGNPYPSAIDAEEFLVANQTKIEGSVWIWTHGLLPTSITDPFYDNFQYNYSAIDYIKYNGLGSTDPDTFTGKIASGQGFMVNMLHTAATPNTIDFNNSFRTGVAYANYANSDFFRNASTIASFDDQEKHRMWLEVTNTTTGQSDRTLLGYATNAANEKDHFYDCIHKPNSTVSFYSLINNEPFIIQGRSLPFDINDRVPMGLSVGTTSNILISVRKADGIFIQGQTIYLEDKLLNIIHNLSSTPYSFTSNAGIFSERFVIRYTDGRLSNDDSQFIENGLFVVSDENIQIISNNIKIKNIDIFDVLGRKLISKTNVDANNVLVNEIVKSNNALIVNITLENNIKISRKILF